ncbi:MAG TPA: hypothetical protein VFI60_05545 [Candidatus Acidoferrum sp.]|nr:hypothetical protein [Candidatus Acidoferrum sp.]
MTDLEKELVEKLAIEEQKPFYGATQDIADMPIEVARKRVEVMFMPLIRSHTQALVAAAYAVCAEQVDEHTWWPVHCHPDTTAREKGLDELSKRIHSLTPADAARELERRNELVLADTIIRFRKMLNRLGIHGYYNEMKREFDLEEVSMSKPAPVERSNENG